MKTWWREEEESKEGGVSKKNRAKNKYEENVKDIYMYEYKMRGRVSKKWKQLLDNEQINKRQKEIEIGR